MSSNPSPINTYYDDDFPQSDSSVSQVRRAMPDYVFPIPGYKYLHSILNIPFYQELLTAISEEDLNLMDISYIISQYYNLDYFDGDYSFFYDRINNAISLFGNNLYPTSLITFFSRQATLSPSSYPHPIQYQNDYLRNLIKKTYLLRQWQGTTRGYNLLFRLINRRGAVHLKTKYPKLSIISNTSEKQYRLMNSTQLFKLIPGMTGTYFPLSYNVKGSLSIQSISNSIALWDTGDTWGQPNETWGLPSNEWDQPIGISTYGTGLFLEIGIDQLLYASGPSNYLMDDLLLQAIDMLLPQVQRASDDIQVGAQLSLVAPNDHRFNTLSQDINYTHANIKAKFQTFNGKWTNTTGVSYIKVGSGGYPDISTYFVSGYPTAQSYTTPPTDIANAIFTSFIGQSEKDLVDVPGYEYINTTFHPRSFVNYIQSIPNISINGLNTLKLISTSLTLPNQNITDGSINYFFEFKVSPVGTYIHGVYTIASITNATPGTILWDAGVSGSTTLTDVSSIPNILNQLSILPSALISAGWTATVSGNSLILLKIATITMTSVPAITVGTATNIIFNTPYVDTSINQQIEVYQIYNSLTGAYDPAVRYYNKDVNQNTFDVTNVRTIKGYTSDSVLASNTYFPTTSNKVVLFQPLAEEDVFPSLKQSLYGSWLLDTITEYPDRLYYKFTIVSTSGSSGNLLWVSDGVNDGIITLSGGETIAAIVALLVAHPPTSGWTILTSDSTSITLVATIVGGFVPSVLSLTAGTVPNIIISSSSDLNNDYLQNAWATTDGWNPNSLSVAVSTTPGSLLFSYSNTVPTPIVTKSGISISTVSINKFIIIKAMSNINGIVLQFTVNGSTILATTATLTTGFQIYAIPINSGITVTSISVTPTPSATVGNIVTFDWIYVGTKNNRPNNIPDDSTNTISGISNAHPATYATGVLDIGQPTYLLNMGGLSSLNINPSGGTSLVDLPQLSFSAHMSISSVAGSDNSNAFIISKSNDSVSAGWALQILPNSAWTGTKLQFTSTRATTKGQWQFDLSTVVTGVDQKFHLAVTYDFTILSAPSIYINGVLMTLTTTFSPNGAILSDSPYFLSWGGSTTQTVFAKIKLQNMRIWGRLLTPLEVSNLYSIEYKRNSILYASSGNPLLVKIDAKNGFIYMKPQYNVDGPLTGNTSFVYQNYTGNNIISTNQNYTLNNIKGIVSITEVGLFDANMLMVAYGVFPPIQYDASIHHLSFNLLFQK